MVGSVLPVLTVEPLSSAVEATVNCISVANNEIAKRAKDIGSAAVFLSLVNAAVVWGPVLFGQQCGLVGPYSTGHPRRESA